MSNTERWTDRAAIGELMQGWMYRDLGQWGRLRGLFHPEGTIAVTWFEGRFADFVNGSMSMGASDFRSKHLIGTPLITFNHHKALAETNAIIVGESKELRLGCNVHARFVDRVEHRDGRWGLVKRACVYDFGAFTFPFGPVAIDDARVESYPREYAALAYLLESAGFPLRRVFPTRGSEQERALKDADCFWLNSTTSP